MIEPTRFRPSPGFCLLEPLFEKDRKIGGVVLPDVVQPLYCKALVVSVGKRTEGDVYDWQPDDVVLIVNKDSPRTEGHFMRLTGNNGRDYLLLSDAEIVGRDESSQQIQLVQ